MKDNSYMHEQSTLLHAPKVWFLVINLPQEQGLQIVASDIQLK
jgi:hypothetical protein